MKKRLLVLLTVLLIAAFVLVPRIGSADLGDFSGGGDYGGGDYGGGSDWGGSDWDSSDWGSSSSGYTSRGGSGGFPAILIVVIVVIVIIVLSVSRSKNQTKRSTTPGATRTAASKLAPISTLMERDPNFSPEDLKEWLQNLYIKMQDCCTNRDVEPIRPYFADALWQQFDRQMKQLKAMHRTNRVERVAVLSVDLRGCYQDKNEDVIIAEIYARITDYTVDDETGKVVLGSKTQEKFMTYEYALSRPIGKMTEAYHEGVTDRHCPNCGAPLSVNESIKCPYCGSVLTFSDHEWTVHAIKGIRQQTAK